MVNLSPAYSQPHNAEIYKSLVQDFLTKNQPPNILIDEQFEKWIPEHKVDTSARSTNRIGPPDISYKNLKDKRFHRKIEVSVEIKDSLLRSETLTYSDTLTSKQLKQVNKSSPKNFRAELPTTSARILTPLAIVTASIGGLISLFYIRSR